ncbi:MAG: PAS domain S-box protein, partial [Gemmatimonadota bacterium]|nr:PAS domain S-box protein [Gemmatimonadota bacterium]
MNLAGSAEEVSQLKSQVAALEQLLEVHERTTIEQSEKLEEQSYLTQTITDNATAGMFMMDVNGHPTFMNPAAQEMTGYTLDEIRGMPLHDAIHHTHPDGTPYPMSECPIDRALPENNEMRAHEDIFVRKDGSFFPVSVAARPILQDEKPVGTVVEVRDVTEARRIEAERERLIRALDVERVRLAELFREAPAFIAVVRGLNHVFELANPPYLQLIGNRDILGKPVAEALPEVVEQGFGALLDQVYLSGEPFLGNAVPILLRRAPGAPPEERYVNFVYQPVREVDGAVGGIFVHGVDVTDQVEARRQVEQLEERL